VFKFGRIHHHVDYRKYKSNQLILKKRIKVPQTPNNYGMELVNLTVEEAAAEALFEKQEKSVNKKS